MDNIKTHYSNCLIVRRNLKKFSLEVENTSLKTLISCTLDLLSDEIDTFKKKIEKTDRNFCNSLLTIYDFIDKEG